MKNMEQNMNLTKVIIMRMMMVKKQIVKNIKKIIIKKWKEQNWDMDMVTIRKRKRIRIRIILKMI